MFLTNGKQCRLVLIIMRERELPVLKMHFQDNFLIQHKLLSISIVRLLTLIGPVEQKRTALVDFHLKWYRESDLDDL